MPSRAEMLRPIRKWLNSRLDPTSSFLVRHPDRYRDFRSLANGLHDVVPHPRLFFLIILPGSLHIASLAYHLVPSDVRVVVILCNVDAWEEAWARANFKGAWILKSRFRYRHHEILNLLLREVPQPFGIIDFDCFVFQPAYLRAVEFIDERTSAQVFFANHNEVLDIWVPETFLLTLNQPVLAELIARYKVGTDQICWDDLLPVAQQRLATLGIGPNQLPESYKPAFDTLRVLLMLAIADGYPPAYITKHGAHKYTANDVFHIGGSSDSYRDFTIANDYQSWGSYFWIRRLELIDDKELRERYLAQFGFGTSAHALARFSARPQEDLLKFIDNLAAGKVLEATQLLNPPREGQTSV
jgi:hypothetical protein